MMARKTTPHLTMEEEDDDQDRARGEDKDEEDDRQEPQLVQRRNLSRNQNPLGHGRHSAQRCH